MVKELRQRACAPTARTGFFPDFSIPTYLIFLRSFFDMSPASTPSHSSHSSPVEITAADLPLHCPRSNAQVWNLHPRVFLDVAHTGEAVCPYCSAHYVLKGEAPKGH